MSNVTVQSSDPDRGESAAERSGRHLVYFAAERTLMSWIRAALAFMALGFVIDRFGLVVHAMAPQAGTTIQPSTWSFLAGTGLVVAGAGAAVVAVIRYAHFAWRYRQAGDTEPGYGLEFAIAFTAFVAIAGAVVAGYLMRAGY